MSAPDDPRPRDRRVTAGPLPLAARRALWEQIWNRLLSPPDRTHGAAGNAMAQENVEP